LEFKEQRKKIGLLGRRLVLASSTHTPKEGVVVVD
jgi:hypothetical protein